jgi:hypothetical protein
MQDAKVAWEHRPAPPPNDATGAAARTLGWMSAGHHAAAVDADAVHLSKLAFVACVLHGALRKKSTTITQSAMGHAAQQTKQQALEVGVQVKSGVQQL